MPIQRYLRASVVLLGVSLMVTACGSGTGRVANGHVLRMVAVKNPIFPPAVPAGYTLYSLTYESEGKPVQAYLGVPPGKGPFQLLVALHGGSPFRQKGASSSYGFTAATSADDVLPALVVFFPNYRGYRPSPGTVQDGYHDYLDALNGLTALRHIRSLHIAPHDTYLAGTSLGGFVALRLAAADRNVRAVLLTSPWSGMDTILDWLKPRLGQNPQYRQAYETLRRYAGAQPGPWLRRNSVPFAEIHVPILIIGGTKDPIVPPYMLRYLDQRLSAKDSDVVLTFISGGHAPTGREWLDDFDTFMGREGLNWLVPQP